MEMSNLTQAIVEDVTATAALGDESLQDAAQRLSRTIASAVRTHVLEALGQAAMELTEQLDTSRVEVRLAGSEAELVVVRDEPEWQAPGDDDNSARISLRLPEALKTRAEAAAAAEGVSTNAWLVRTIAARLDNPGRARPGNRLRGFGQS
jgi:hypothetical protein